MDRKDYVFRIRATFNAKQQLISVEAAAKTRIEENGNLVTEFDGHSKSIPATPEVLQALGVLLAAVPTDKVASE